MKYSGFALLLLLSLGLPSCSSDGGPSGGLIGLLTGGVIGHLADQNISNPYTNNGTTTTTTNGTVVGSNGSTVLGANGTTTGTVLNSNGTVSTAASPTTTIVSNGGATGSTGLYDNKGLLAGALGGASAGFITDQFREAEIKKKYEEGYAKGKSDSIKELYFLKQKAQKHGEEDPPVQYRYYEVEVPAHTTSDGVFIDRHTRVIEVVE